MRDGTESGCTGTSLMATACPRLWSGLSVGVQRHKSERGRLSYVLWEENGVVPYLAIEVVSKT